MTEHTETSDMTAFGFRRTNQMGKDNWHRFTHPDMNRGRRTAVKRTIIETVSAMNIDLPRGPDS